MKHLEDEHQKALFKWAELQRVPGAGMLRDYMFAVPNGGYRKPQEAARLKGLGVTKGVPDVFCMLSRHGRPFLPIEMKKPLDAFDNLGDALRAISPEQMEWLDRLRSLGTPGYVCYGWDEARALLMTYIHEVPTATWPIDFETMTKRLEKRILPAFANHHPGA